MEDREQGLRDGEWGMENGKWEIDASDLSIYPSITLNLDTIIKEVLKHLPSLLYPSARLSRHDMTRQDRNRLVKNKVGIG